VNAEWTEKIDAVLERVRDPESGLPVARLGIVKRVRLSEKEKKLYVFLDTYGHLPKCVTCAAIAQTVLAGIARDLNEAFGKEFPGFEVVVLPALTA
jgi:metal-sulfur cluster biosynthetic enzyme